MENKYKTIEELNKKTWYRALKTVYILSVSIPLIILAIPLLAWGETVALWYVGLIILAAVVLKKSFYYIVLGTINPKK